MTEKMSKKKIVVSSIALAVALGVGVYGVKQVSAQNNPPFNSLVDKIASKFNLNKDEVAKVFEESRLARRTEMMKERQASVEERLTEAVKNGEITEEQKKLVLNKMDELEKQREANWAEHQNLSESQRLAQRKAYWAELEKWASDNGIDLKYLMFGSLGGGRGRGFHQGMNSRNGDGKGFQQ